LKTWNYNELENKRGLLFSIIISLGFGVGGKFPGVFYNIEPLKIWVLAGKFCSISFTKP